MDTKHHTSLYFIVIGIFLLLISGTFLSEGIARIGLDNAVVAQRMASGIEDFWLPSLDAPGSLDRSNYLPLGYWMESEWFRLFGDNSFLVEKCYSVLVLLLVGLLIVWIWTLMGNSRHSGWLPLLCLITVPLVSWSATSNLLEGTMTLFVLLAIAFVLMGRNAAYRSAARGLARKRPARPYPLVRIVYAILAALMLELAFLVKGVMGLFPVAFPLIFWAFDRRENVIFPILSTLLILITWVVTLFMVVIFSPNVYDHLYNYLHHQLIGGFLHVQTVASHFYILYVLVVQLAIPLALFVLVSLLNIRRLPLNHVLRYRKYGDQLTADQVRRSKMGWIFLTAGLFGIVPIMLGLKQQDFYVVPTLPFFALALGCFMYNMVEHWLENIGRVARYVLSGLAVLFFVAGILLNANSIHRVNSNATLLGDMKDILPLLDEGETISVSPEVMQTTEVEEYFYRYKRVKFTDSLGNRYMLMLYSNLDVLPEGVYYREVSLPTQQYKLYETYAPEPIIDTLAITDTTDATCIENEIE